MPCHYKRKQKVAFIFCPIKSLSKDTIEAPFYCNSLQQEMKKKPNSFRILQYFGLIILNASNTFFASPKLNRICSALSKHFLCKLISWTSGYLELDVKLNLILLDPILHYQALLCNQNVIKWCHYVYMSL